MEKTIKQKAYGDLKVNNDEKDMVQVWGELHTNDPQVVFISREKLPDFIKAMSACLTKS